MKHPTILGGYPEIAALLEGADHVDEKIVQGDVSLREFIAGVAAYQPGWTTLLYVIRGVLVRLLGLKQERQPVSARLRPADVPMNAGQRLIFFTVKMAREDHYQVLEIRDSHLDALLITIAETRANSPTRFHVITVVHFHNLAGVIYFKVIRPFHHLVVGAMAQAGTRGSAA